MSEIIKLENIVIKQKECPVHGRVNKSNFCPQCGAKLFEEAVEEEHVCSNCRHLVEGSDKFCHHCGEALEPQTKVEHYERGKKLSDAEFETEKAKIKEL